MLWFKHSSDARNSLKLRKVRRKYGADGYAIYWFCLEAIAHDVDKDNLTFNLKEDAETIGFELTIQEKRVNEIMVFMVDIGLFENSNNMITCMKLAERLDKSMTNSPKMRAWLGDKGKEKVSQSVMTLNDTVSTCAELDKTILDKTKLNNNKDIVQQAAPCTFEDDFNYFWVNSGLKKLNKKAAKPAFKKAMKLLKLDSLGTAEKLTADCQMRLVAMQQGFDMIHPTTYLNGQRWEDEIVVNQTQPRYANKQPAIDNTSTDWMNNQTFEEKYCDKR